MGSWGIKALESDTGLELIYLLKTEYLPKHKKLTLGGLIGFLKEEGFLGESMREIDFLYDNTAIALAELYFEWQETGKCTYLTSKKVVNYRKKKEQIPQNKEDLKMIEEIYNYFPDACDFEACAAQIAQLMDKNIISFQLTRAVKDGGRDAIGKYRIGVDKSNILIEFTLEAKRYQLDDSVGVKETSRLISRIKHREFGILVTTSYVELQAYKEIVEDNHPVIIISAIDIVEILKKAGIKTSKDVKGWLKSNF